jgi:NAD(P)-dependent dehydrogenase (short-subunit alcohol dehydrogenase family)
VARLRDQTAIVTGGASGIGRAVVDRYVAEGANVVVADLGRVEEPPPEWAGRVEQVAADITTYEGNRAAVERALEAFGSLDVFVANAGINDAFTPLLDLEPGVLAEAFDQIYAVNVKGLLLGCRAAVPELIGSRGSVVVTLSNSSFYPDGGGPVYVSSKHAALGVVRQLAHELAPAVRVNAVAPGGTVTDIRLPRAMGLEDGAPRRAQPDSGLEEMIASVTPLALAARPADHAGAYVLLADREDSRTMTGAVISTDGGLGVRGIRRVRGGEELLSNQRGAGV